jgi:phage I-like protein
MNDTIHTIDEFVSVTAGNPFRVFPFGTIYKNGVKRVITPEFAKQITLPHFKAPIKLSSHDDNAPAGGFIVGLEVREDGLYVIPEWNEAGMKAMQEGAFRYNSPEILWSGGIEDPKTGDVISAPLLLGTALLHMPHLGEATALYSIEPIHTEDITMEEKNITVPASLWDKFIAPLFAKESEVKEVVKEVEPEDYAATKVERDELKARITEQEQATARKARVDQFDAELKETKADPALSDLLADLPDEKAEAIMKQFKALSAQINESALIEEKGTEGAPVEDPKAAFNAAVLAISTEKKITYNAAFEHAKTAHADLFKAAFPKQ